MRWAKTLQLLDVHSEGEVGKVITSGVIDLPGRTIAEKMDHINKVDDALRRFVMFEPRGGVAASVNLLLPPTRPEADAAFIVLQADQVQDRSFVAGKPHQRDRLVGDAVIEIDHLAHPALLRPRRLPPVQARDCHQGGDHQESGRGLGDAVHDLARAKIAEVLDRPTTTWVKGV